MYMRNSPNTKRRERQFKASKKHLTCFITSSWDLNRKARNLASTRDPRRKFVAGWEYETPNFPIRPRIERLSVFRLENVPHEEYRTLYLFCRRQESCHRRRFLEQFLSLFRGGLSQFWWNIFCFFI